MQAAGLLKMGRGGGQPSGRVEGSGTPCVFPAGRTDATGAMCIRGRAAETGQPPSEKLTAWNAADSGQPLNWNIDDLNSKLPRTPSCQEILQEPCQLQGGRELGMGHALQQLIIVVELSLATATDAVPHATLCHTVQAYMLNFR